MFLNGIVRMKSIKGIKETSVICQAQFSLGKVEHFKHVKTNQIFGPSAPKRIFLRKFKQTQKNLVEKTVKNCQEFTRFLV